MTQKSCTDLDLLARENLKIKELCERYKLIIEGSNDGIWEWDVANDIYKLSLKDKETFGYEESIENFPIKMWGDSLHAEDKERATANLENFIKGTTRVYENTYRLLNKEGIYRWILSKGKGIKDREEKIVYVAGSHTDITEKVEMEKKLYTLAYSDQLTKLSNKEKLNKDFKELIKKDLHNKNVAFFYVDIDEFGYINNTLGYEEGNRLIKRIAAYLFERYAPQHYIARVSADEFLIIYIKEGNKESIEEELKSLIHGIRKERFFEEHDIIITVSVGAAIFKENGNDFFELLRKADTALYCAKRDGKDQFKMYEPQMGEKVYGTIDMINQIRIGMEKKEFEMYYQPIFKANPNKLAGFEALIRWNNPFKGIVSPLEFIPVAEASGQMKNLEKKIIEEVFSQVNQWDKYGEIPFFISINLSGKGLLEKNIVDFLKEQILKYNIKPDLIEFEVTETAMINSMEHSSLALKEIKNLGFKISLDDFGKGYSSLNYLRMLPINKVKLDRDFIVDIESPKDQFFIKSIIDLSQNLGLEVVAEGVERHEELSILQNLNCNYIQGFLLGRPEPVKTTEKLFTELFKKK